ncbi:MAG: TlpA disulfide reductase family protein [Eubacteriales bacterium]|nr:TlpA disulfide reductase family protein [Eubacteriales bacterium]MDY3333283.1 TlpA disulfide reductase family protein [Gallibacter sp.]
MKKREFNKSLRQICVLIMVVILSFTFVACKDNDKQKSDETTQSIEEQTLKNFPKFTGKTLDGSKISNDIFKENDFTVVNFWATWCGPCVKELPELQKISEEYKDKKVAVVGIVYDGQESGAIDIAKKILSEKKVKYKNIIVDFDTALLKYMADDIVGVPTTVVVNNKGEIVGQQIVGTIEAPEALKQLKAIIDNNK